MMHHHVVEHFDKEANFLSPYMVAHPESDRQQLLAAGIHTIFTGHLHVSDIARDYNSDRTDSITEVATGSLCTYPLHYRLVRLHGGKASITTRSIKQVPGCPALQAQARAQVEQAVPDLVDGLARKGYKKLQGAMGHLSGIMGLLGGGMACSIVSFMIMRYMQSGQSSSESMATVSVVFMVLAYALIIGAFIYDLVKVRPMRNEANDKLGGMSKKRLNQLIADEEARKAAKKSK